MLTRNRPRPAGCRVSLLRGTWTDTSRPRLVSVLSSALRRSADIHNHFVCHVGLCVMSCTLRNVTLDWTLCHVELCVVSCWSLHYVGLCVVSCWSLHYVMLDSAWCHAGVCIMLCWTLRGVMLESALCYVALCVVSCWSLH